MKRPSCTKTCASALFLGGIALVVSALVLFLPKRVERAVANVNRAGGQAREIKVVDSPWRSFDEPRRADIIAITSTQENRDGLVAFGRTWVATAGGLRMHNAAERPRTLTWTDGLAPGAVTVLAAFGQKIAAGSTDGSLSLIDDQGVRNVHFVVPGGTHEFPVTDLASDGELLYVGTLGAGLIVWDGHDAASITRAATGESLDEVTALAIGRPGLVLGTSRGDLFSFKDGRLAPVWRGSGPLAERIMALAWDGDTLVVGTPFRLERVENDGSHRTLRDDISVTSLLADHRHLFVGTLEDGVWEMEPELGRARRVGGADRIFRVRLLDQRPVAFGSKAIWNLVGEEVAPLAFAQSPSLSAQSVTTLAVRGREIWTGIKGGTVDIVGDSGQVLRRLPEMDTVNHILVRPEDGEVVLSTEEGVIILSPSGEVQRIGDSDGLLGKSVHQAAALGDLVAYAGSRGIGLANPSGYLQSKSIGFCSSVAWGPDGHLSVGTVEGLVVLTRELEIAHKIALGKVTAMVTTTEGTYVGTETRGIVLVAPDGTVEKIDGLHGIAVNRGALLLDGNHLYVGTRAHGLLAYDRVRKEWKVVSEPLGSRNITSLAATESALWIGTDQGLVRLGRSAIDSLLAPQPQS